jgi:RNA polymerase sigma factor (sigma-70 family)
MENLIGISGLASDNEVVDKILGGQVALFELLIRRYNPLLYKLARSYGFNHADAEDLMQETHFAAYSQLAKFRREASYKTWISRIHLNNCYHKMNNGYHKHFVAADNSAAPVHASVSHDDPETRLASRELSRIIEQSLDAIPSIYRTVFVMREIEGFSTAETAGLLNISEVNVKVRLNRAKALLQNQLRDVYSSDELYAFNLKYCDKIVAYVFERITGTAHDK